jgi:hypothetical protein
MALLLSPVRRGAVVLIAAFILQLAFAASYVGALHDPEPHGLPDAVVAPGGAVDESDIEASVAAGAAL